MEQENNLDTAQIINQLNNQIVKVGQVLFGRYPDPHSPDLTLYQYDNILIRNSGPRAGSWITTLNPETNKRDQGNNILELIRFRSEMSETEALAWVRNKGLIDPPPSPTAPELEPDRRDHVGDRDGEKTRFIEQVTELGKPVIGTQVTELGKPV